MQEPPTALSRAVTAAHAATVHRSPHAPRPHLARPGKAARLLVAAAWGLAVAVTVTLTLDPAAPPGIHNSSLRLALDTAEACVGLLAAYLAHERFRRDRALHDLLLTQALVILVMLGALIPSLLPALRGAADLSNHVWLSFAGRIGASFLVAAAAIAALRRDPARVSHRRAAVSWGILIGTSALLLVFLQGVDLPPAVTREPPEFDATWNGASMHGLFSIGNLIGCAAFVIASFGFLHLADRTSNAFFTWLAPAAVLAAFTRIHQLLVPTAYTDWLSTGDAFRSGFYLLLLVGTAREIRQYWSSRAVEAVIQDRQRMARELHDGVVQELAFIRSEASAESELTPTHRRIVHASDRALDEARAALTSLHRDGSAPLGAALAGAAHESAKRHGVHVDVDLDVDTNAQATPAVLHAVSRIMREAISNAARHGRATVVRVRLTAEPGGYRLTISDNGSGFDVAGAAEASAGFGLISMRERAHALPGELTIDSAPGSGTVVTITW